MKFIPNKVVGIAARQSLKVQKHSPSILFGAGVVGVGVGTVLACRATLKMEEILQNAENVKAQADLAYDMVNSDNYAGDKTYTQAEMLRDKRVILVQTGRQVATAYAPAVIVLSLSVAALTQSHIILNRRNAAVGAAYAALDKGFSEYRSRVIDRFGEDTDRELRFGYEETKERDEATGKKKIVRRVATGPGPSIYARFFDETSTSWQREPEYNLMFLKAQQDYLNDRLRLFGHVFLNEAYDALGLERSMAGQSVGWVLNKNGDNYIDFGIFRGDTDTSIDFVNGREGAVLLDFNVDGVILNLIDEFQENN